MTIKNKKPARIIRGGSKSGDPDYKLLMFSSERTHHAADTLLYRRFCHLNYKTDEYSHVLSLFFRVNRKYNSK